MTVERASAAIMRTMMPGSDCGPQTEVTQATKKERQNAPQNSGDSTALPQDARGDA